jgi:DNA-binding helix-hairpin-helix protein with protein kinase domain
MRSMTSSSGQILRAGQRVRTQPSGLTCEVEQFLARGGQGEVYRARLGGSSVALKWYLSKAATVEQRAALEILVRKNPPNDKFLWPMELAFARSVPGFGYVMRLREPRYKGIAAWLKRDIEPTFRALATAGLGLADSYLQLHSQGLCYRDISFGNVFLDPDNGDVLICDNDNVAVDEATVGGVKGTPRFMAPEIVRGEALPSTQTDLFSLAVLLFYIFVVHHPFEGKREAEIHCLDLPAMTKLFGTEPVFIFDPADRSNAPVPGYQDNALVFWPIYPQFLRALFTRTFTKGVRDPRNGRVRESEWRAAMAALRDAIFYCAACGAENFYDPDMMKNTGGRLRPCWSCSKEIRLPPRMRIGTTVVMLNHDTKLYPHHVDRTRLYDFSHPIAQVSRNPRVPHAWGLKNLSGQTWTGEMADGTVFDVPPGRSMALAAGSKLRLGEIEGEIRV